MDLKKTKQSATATEGKKVPLVLGARITEKAAQQNGANAYTFNVEGVSNKTELKKQIEKAYKIRPLAINVINTPKKRVFVRGKWGVKGGGKKVVVFLKKGDSIDLQ